MLRLFRGDANIVLDKLIIEGVQVDSVITDPPYGLKFMGKKWDYNVPSVELWEKVLKVLKPGGIALIFAGSRTQHRMAVNVEDAGFEIKDTIMWVYGSGFPKSHNISKALDKQAGAERVVIGEKTTPDGKPFSARTPNSKEGYNENCEHNSMSGKTKHNTLLTAPATPEAQLWEGWGTALKPAYEPIIVAIKPLDGTYANNALKHGVAGLNIDGCRVGTEKVFTHSRGTNTASPSRPTERSVEESGRKTRQDNVDHSERVGRFPANLILDSSEEVEALFPYTKSGKDCKRKKPHETTSMAGTLATMDREEVSYGDQGSASRFFQHCDYSDMDRLYYCGKASKKDRGKGNNHPTVKPLALMRYLARLSLTPTGGIVLSPFMGSGTIGVACRLEGRGFIGIEIDSEYYQIAKRRITNALKDYKDAK